MSESNSSDPAGQSADLRTRIAAALRNMTGDLTYEAMADAVIAALLPKREGLWGWIDGTVSTNGKTGNPITLEIEPGEVIPLSVEDARNVALALLAAVAECEADK